MGVIKLLKQNKVCAITPDGPRGPKEKVKSGLPLIAKKIGCPVVPLSYSVKYRKLLNTWDSFVLPVPFNRGVVVTGRPVYPESREDMEEFRKRIERGISNTTRKAQNLRKKL